VGADNLGDDEIDLRELFAALWRGKWFITLCVCGAVALAALYLRAAERKYTVSYVFQPVASDEAMPNLGGLGGLASLAGVALPSSSSGDFATFKFLLQSEEVAAELMRDESLVRRVFVREWDEAGALFRRPEGGALSSQIATIKLLLTGEGPGDYLAPSAVRLSEWMKQAIAASTNRDTGFLTLTGESADPALIVDVMAAAAAATDRLLKERYVGSSEQTMGFYQRQLAKARAREHREALAKLIAQEDQKLMLASKGDYFVAEPLTTPSVSLHPTSPKSSLILALAVVLGGFLGAALVLIRKAARS
jgi:uncharacterized protein involved in exopolysaccharide biosynthesis